MYLLGNRRMASGSTDLVECEPAFTLGCEEAPFLPGVDATSAAGLAQIEERRKQLLFQDLDQLARKHQIGQGDILLINSLRHWSLEPVIEWLEKVGPSRAPVVVLILHYTPHRQLGVPDAAASVYQKAFRRLANSPVRSRILLCTDSEQLSAEYRNLHDLPIAVLPVPHCGAPAGEAEPEHDVLSVVFAGEARADKGFDLLAPAIREVLSTSPRREVVFNIQAYGTEGRPEAAIRTKFPVSDAVRVHSHPLDERQYEAFIGTADLVLIPYSTAPYRAQTSGIYCEAAALGIPVVVPSGTWMADQVLKRGGGVLFESGNAASLAQACLEALRNYGDLRQSAIRAAPAWRSFHNAANFIGHLKALIRDLPIVKEA